MHARLQPDTLRAIGGDDRVALAIEDAGEDRASRRARGCRRNVRRQPHQRPGQDVGDDQVEGPRCGKGRMVEAGAVAVATMRDDAVERGILARRRWSAIGSMSVASTGICAAWRWRSPARALPVPRSSALRGRSRRTTRRSSRGSRPWCRDGRCRRPGRPRSRWRCRRGGRVARSWGRARRSGRRRPVAAILARRRPSPCRGASPRL